MEKLFKINRIVNYITSFILVIVFFVPIISLMTSNGTADNITHQSFLDVVMSGGYVAILYLLVSLLGFGLTFIYKSRLASMAKFICMLTCTITYFIILIIVNYFDQYAILINVPFAIIFIINFISSIITLIHSFKLNKKSKN